MSELKELYIIGAGGFGREVAWLVERINEYKPTWNLKGFIDDNKELREKTVGSYPVVGKIKDLLTINTETWVVCAVGSAKMRKEIIQSLDSNPFLRYATLIDPSVICSNRIVIGDGSIICAGTILTVDITIGKHVIINLDCTLGHDAIVSDFSTIYPGVNVSGGVSLGKCVELGTGSRIIQGLNINDNVIIGAGAVVVRNIQEEGTYVGVPVRRI